MRRQKKAAPISIFQFETPLVNSDGKIIERRKGAARYYSEDLGNGVKLDMVDIPGGRFMMGAPEAEIKAALEDGYRYNRLYSFRIETPQHEVTVQPFYIGKYEMTQAQWRAVASLPKVEMDLNPGPSDSKGDDLPFGEASWKAAVEFCARLSTKTGRSYRLPTEAEWEYACRAGTTTPFAFGETITPDIVNYIGSFPYGSAPKGIDRLSVVPVGSLGAANAFGLYDMHGNEAEWCNDVFDPEYYKRSLHSDPLGPSTGSTRVVRGCGWSGSAGWCRSAHRSASSPDGTGGLGFRVVMHIAPLAEAQSNRFSSTQGFSFKYPEGWVVATKEQQHTVINEYRPIFEKFGDINFDRVSVMVFNPEDDESIENVNVVVSPGRMPVNEDSRQTLVQVLSEQMRNAGLGITDINSNVASFGANQAISVQWTMNHPVTGSSIRQWQVAIVQRQLEFPPDDN